MNLYLINATATDLDMFDSAVVAAKSAKDARNIHPGGESYEGPWNSACWAVPSKVGVSYIGRARVTQKRGVVVSSFNAG